MSATNSIPAISFTQRTGQAHRQWEQAIRAAVNHLRCAIPGVITAVNLGGDQTCTVQVALNEEIILPDGTLKKVAIDPLIHVPLVMPRAGGWSITFPVAIGDEVLVIFADMAIDQWWQGGAPDAASGKVPDQIEIRRHDLSDGFAILGTWCQKRLLSNYSASSMQLRSDDGQTVIDIAASGITINSPQRVQVVSPAMSVAASGGTAAPLATQEFVAWFQNTYMPTVSYKTPTPPMMPTVGMLTTVLNGE